MIYQDFDRAMKEKLHREPFRPFVIEMDDGRRMVVTERQAVHHYVGPALLFYPDGNFDFVDAESVKQLLDLEAVEPK
jgi:hypothetical protein